MAKPVGRDEQECDRTGPGLSSKYINLKLLGDCLVKVKSQHNQDLREEFGSQGTTSEVEWKKKLMAEVERYRLATAAASIGVWDWYVAENRFVWDEQMFRLYGVEREGITPSYDVALNRVCQEDQSRWIEAVQAALRGEKNYDLEFRIVWPNGERRFIKANGLVLRDEAGRPIRMVGSNYDITDLRRAEKESLARLAWQNAVLDSASSAIIATTPDGLIQTFNPAAQRMLGYCSEEVIGKLTLAISHDPQEVVARGKLFSQELGEQIEPGLEVFVTKARKNLPNEHETIYIRKDGTRLPVQLSVTALRDSDQVITGFLGLALDISGRKRAEGDIRAYTRELEEINQASYSQMVKEVEPYLLTSYFHRIFYNVDNIFIFKKQFTKFHAMNSFFSYLFNQSKNTNLG